MNMLLRKLQFIYSHATIIYTNIYSLRNVIFNIIWCVFLSTDIMCIQYPYIYTMRFLLIYTKHGPPVTSRLHEKPGPLSALFWFILFHYCTCYKSFVPFILGHSLSFSPDQHWIELTDLEGNLQDANYQISQKPSMYLPNSSAASRIWHKVNF